VNVCEKVNPEFWIPESKSPLGFPGIPEVTLCPLAFQVQVTVSPTLIATDAGENLRLPFGATSTEKVVAAAFDAPMQARTAAASTPSRAWRR
jgi:hypothetical protein